MLLFFLPISIEGSEDSAKRIWQEVTDGSSDITMKQLSSLLSKLDKSADQVEKKIEIRFKI